MPAQKQTSSKPSRPPLFYFLQYGPIRDVAEIITASLPGAAILVFFMSAVGVPTAYTKSNWFAAPFIPVTCLLPVVIGMISPLALEWVRASNSLSLKRSIACSLLSGVLGSVAGVAAIFIFSMLVGSGSPYGPSISGLLLQGTVSLAIIAVASALSAIGGAVLVLFIKKSPKESG